MVKARLACVAERAPAVHARRDQADGGGEDTDGASGEQHQLGAGRLHQQAAEGERGRPEQERAELVDGADAAEQPRGDVVLQPGGPQQFGELLAEAEPNAHHDRGHDAVDQAEGGGGKAEQQHARVGGTAWLAR